MVFECFKCKVDEDHALLFDTITPEGIMKVCRKCSFKIDTPVVKTPSEEKIIASYGRGSVYERLSRSSGINPQEHRNRLSEKENLQIEERDKNLRELVEKNVQKNNKDSDDRLIKNFHWAIMMARRESKISKEKLAKEIGEHEASIYMLEKGKLPKGHEIIIKKIENYFGITLFREGVRIISQSNLDIDRMRQEFMKKIENNPDAVFDRKNPEQLSIGDLKKLKDEQEMKLNPKIFNRKEEVTLTIRGEKIDFGKEEINNTPEFVEKKEGINSKRLLSDREIDDLIFGRR